MKKITTTIIGALLTVYMLGFALLNNFNIGVFIPMVCGIIIALWYYVPDSKVIKSLKILFITGISIFIAFMVFIGAMAQTNSAQYDEDAVIVLGCGLHGSLPSLNLADRLDAAIEYHSKNPNALIVVSGGQGPQEDCTEAQAMAKYLTDRGIDKDKIILEDKATSTNENYRFSKEILDKKLGNDYKTVYVTNSFHSYRAGELAKLNGLDSRACNAITRIQSLIPNYAREVLAVIQLWVFGR